MTPKFDNLASLLMEMPRAISDEKRLEIAEYIEQFPDDSYEKIAAAFEVSRKTVATIAKELDVQRGEGGGSKAATARAVERLRARTGKETHIARKLTDVQEKQILDYWLANHHEITFPELARWIKQQFDVDMHRVNVAKVVKRAASKHNERLPAFDRGKGMRLRKQRSQHRNEPGSGKLPTQGSQQFSGSDQIVPSNPKHGGPAHPPTLSMDQDKRL